MSKNLLFVTMKCLKIDYITTKYRKTDYLTTIGLRQSLRSKRLKYNCLSQ
jgi:hypothetical protein